MYINSINYFRGIAILFIVFGHCLALYDFNYDSVLVRTFFNVIIGGTTFFVFISGFLFHHIFYKNFIYKIFIVKKMKYVLLPYLILSTLPLIYLFFRICFDSLFSTGAFSSHYEALLSFPIVRHYLTGFGKSFAGYWYIPFIMIVFAISPIFIRFINFNFKTQSSIAIVLLICSIFMHRGTYQNVYSVFQNVLFFTPVYLFGIIASEKRDLIYSKWTGKEFYILFLVIILLIIQVHYEKLGNYTKKPFAFEGIDLMVIQKIVFCLFFMIFLNRFEKYNFKFLEIIAENSFGVFFIHGIVISGIGFIKYKLGFLFPENSFIFYCLLALFVFSLSIMATLIVKRIFPKYSRYLVGC